MYVGLSSIASLWWDVKVPYSARLTIHRTMKIISEPTLHNVVAFTSVSLYCWCCYYYYYAPALQTDIRQRMSEPNRRDFNRRFNRPGSQPGPSRHYNNANGTTSCFHTVL